MLQVCSVHLASRDPGTLLKTMNTYQTNFTVCGMGNGMKSTILTCACKSFQNEINRKVKTIKDTKKFGFGSKSKELGKLSQSVSINQT